MFFDYGLLNEIAKEAKLISKSLDLKEMEFQNIVVAAWFSFSVVKEICLETAMKSTKLLNDFFNQINYPENERTVVENAITSHVENRYAESKIQKVVCDAINSRLAKTDFLENIILLKEEANRIGNSAKSELFFLKYYLNEFIKRKYYTEYAIENLSMQRERNFQLLQKRIDKLESSERNTSSNELKVNNSSLLTNKETEDLFKLAFRNYNHLVSVADSKASLLIHVNSIIISFMLAFVLSRVERYPFLLWPTVLLVVTCTLTILLSILASRPQKNSFLEDKHSHSYQRFFFGSFDLIDSSFRHANWEEYYVELKDLFINSKESIYLEIYKESFNVRKVLSNKFSYLSKAYWVFILGLLASIIAFISVIQTNPLIV